MPDQLGGVLLPSSDGWFVGGLVGGWATESVSVFGVVLVRAAVSLGASQMCVFSQVLVVPRLSVCNIVDVCVRACAISIWVFIHFPHRCRRTVRA